MRYSPATNIQNRATPSRWAGLALLLLNVTLWAQPHHPIIITEIMADPTPRVGLPDCEWIEIRNTTGQPVPLAQWRVGSGTTISGPLPAIWLEPDSAVLLTSVAGAPLLNGHGKVIGISSFPSLINEGTTLWLRDPQGNSRFAVAYESSWYRNAIKAGGGWSLEMIDTRQPCSGAVNWKASVDAKGGTPGRINSVATVGNDIPEPQVLHSYALNERVIRVEYTQALDSGYSVQPSLYQLRPATNIVAVRSVPPLHRQLELLLSDALVADTVYQLQIKGIRSCQSNGSTNKVLIRTGWPGIVQSGDLVINEILFDPRSGGSDFLELYNRSKRIVDLSGLLLGNRQSNGNMGSTIRVLETPRLIFPGDHYACTGDAEALQREYLVADPRLLIQTGGFPSLPDTRGNIVVLDQQGKIIDELNYENNWHFPLLSNKEGVSLERIDPMGPTQQKDNWHSAASTEGYATPARKNSQRIVTPPGDREFMVSPALFSPDMDGIDDNCVISYHLDEPGYIASLYIADNSGTIVRTIADRSLLGKTGQWFWNGTDQHGKLLAAGNYLLVINAYNLSGRTAVIRRPIIIAHRF